MHSGQKACMTIGFGHEVQSTENHHSLMYFVYFEDSGSELSPWFFTQFLSGSQQEENLNLLHSKDSNRKSIWTIKNVFSSTK